MDKIEKIEGKCELPDSVRSLIEKEIKLHCENYPTDEKYSGGSYSLKENGSIECTENFSFMAAGINKFEASLFKAKLNIHNKCNPDNNIQWLVSSSIGVCGKSELDVRSNTVALEYFKQEVMKESRLVFEDIGHAGFKDFSRIMQNKLGEIVDRCEGLERFLIVGVENKDKKYSLCFPLISIFDEKEYIAISDKESYYTSVDNKDGLMSS